MYVYRNGHFAFNTLGQNSNVGKLKTLSGALDTMVRTKHAFQLIGRELAGEPGQVGGEDAGPALTCLVLAARRVRVRVCVQTHTYPRCTKTLTAVCYIFSGSLLTQICKCIFYI